MQRERHLHPHESYPEGQVDPDFTVVQSALQLVRCFISIRNIPRELEVAREHGSTANCSE